MQYIDPARARPGSPRPRRRPPRRAQHGGPRLVIDWDTSVGRFSHYEVTSMFVCAAAAGKPPTCVGPLLTRQADYINRCGKDPDCTISDVYRVKFRCNLDLHDDVIELSRDPEQIEPDPGIDVVPPRPDICDALPLAGKHKLTF